ncbi:DksA-like zinc-finger protein [Aeromonas phage BUCT695]|uniref:DksA-like zinc-finger protein n=1 Tax=Aeromonas phage BUCT695 TaxID=2908630 RepID=UPI00232923E7|nr:DksA-like zinc-finger protein [Aeromonas phage BUCT695]UIW10495.1 putative zinc-finger containing protein [Aeromonas phage BUCT695]
MAGGFYRDDSFFETESSNIMNGIDFARANLSKGESEEFCLDCDEPIPQARREAAKGCKYCIQCQTKHDAKLSSYYNRRGSKDSQIR